MSRSIRRPFSSRRNQATSPTGKRPEIGRRSARTRRLQVESLEQRRLLAVDVADLTYLLDGFQVGTAEQLDLAAADRFGTAVAAVDYTNPANEIDHLLFVGSPGANGGEGEIRVLEMGPAGIESELPISDGVGGILPGQVNGLVNDGVDAEFGTSIAILEVRGDQILFAVGAPGQNEVHVLCLDVTRQRIIYHRPINLTDLLPDLRGTTTAADRFGQSVTVGDLDGNGLNEIIVGASQNTPGSIETGAVYVLEYSQLAPLVLGNQTRLSGVSGEGFDSAPGLASQDRFGDAVLAIPSLNAGGVDDILVGGPRGDGRVSDGVQPGFGTLGQTLNLLLPFAAASRFDPSSLTVDPFADEFGSSFGFSSQIPRLDGDGIRDLLIGSPGARGAGGESDVGAIYVADLNADGVVVQQRIDGTQIAGLIAGDRFGESIAILGDIDNNGSIEVAVGVSGNDFSNRTGGNTLIDSGAVAIVSIVEGPGFTKVPDNDTSPTARRAISNGTSISYVLDTQPEAGRTVLLELTSNNTSLRLRSASTTTPATSALLRFDSTNWNVPQSAFAVIEGDMVVGDLETAEVTARVTNVGVPIVQQDPRYSLLVDTDICYVQFDDPDVTGLGLIVTSTPPLSVSENATTDTFTVALSASPPAGSVVVLQVASSDATEASASFGTSNQITFGDVASPGVFAWNDPQTVTVTGVDDLVFDMDQPFLATVSVVDAASHPAFAAVSDQTVAGINVDNELPPPPFSLSGTVINDVDADGVRDAGETGLAAATVYLDIDNSNSLTAGDATATTAADGSYTFASLSPGNYTVRVVPPAGFLQTGTNPPIVTGVSGVNQSGIDFTLVRRLQPQGILGSISGNVFNDINGNGVFDGTDTPSVGTTMRLFGVGDARVTDGLGNFVADQTTDINGNYTFGNLLPTGISIPTPSGSLQGPASYTVVPVIDLPQEVRYGDAVTIATGVNTGSLVVADLDGDGDQDIAVANRETSVQTAGTKEFFSSITVLNNNINTATGAAFTKQSDIRLPGQSPILVAIDAGDLDGDGDQDIAFTSRGNSDVFPNGNGDYVGVLLNQGSGSTIQFGPLARIEPLPGGRGPVGVAAGNFGSSILRGSDDLAVINSTSNDLSGLNLLVPADNSINILAGLDPVDVAVADINGDTFDDVVVAHHDGTILVGLSSFDSASATLNYLFTNFDSGANAVDVELANVDSDSRLEIVVATWGKSRPALTNNIRIYDVNPIVSSPNRVALQDSFAAQLNPTDISIGRPAPGNTAGDLVVVDELQHTLQVFRSTGSGYSLASRFSTRSATQTGFLNPQQVVLTDLDGDNLDDAVIANATNGISILYAELGSNAFSSQTVSLGAGQQLAGVDFDIRLSGLAGVGGIGGGIGGLASPGGGFGAIAAPPAGEPLSNPNNRFDVDANGSVSALDALRLINALNERTPQGESLAEFVANRASTFYPDVSGDGELSAVDALMVINRLNGSTDANASSSNAELVAVSAIPLTSPARLDIQSVESTSSSQSPEVDKVFATWPSDEESLSEPKSILDTKSDHPSEETELRATAARIETLQQSS